MCFGKEVLALTQSLMEDFGRFLEEGWHGLCYMLRG